MRQPVRPTRPPARALSRCWRSAPVSGPAPTRCPRKPAPTDPRHGYVHKISFLRGNRQSPSELLPRVHRVVSLLKRWLLGTHQGAVSVEHLDYYLDEFTFRFNRRKSRSRGKLFFRLVQQAVAAEPTTYRSIIESARADWSPNHNLLGVPE